MERARKNTRGKFTGADKERRERKKVASSQPGRTRNATKRGFKVGKKVRDEKFRGGEKYERFERGRNNRVVEKQTKRRKAEIEAIRGELQEEPKYVIQEHPKLQSYTPKPRKPKALGEEGVRLNKFIANSGICSRREADEYILEGLITVNGEVVTELGTKVFMNDEVRYDGSIIKGEEKVYIVMNKPKDFITTTSDPHAEKKVVDLVAGKCKERVYPVGRLDRDTTGVLLLTNDGELTEKLTHPSYKKKKIYQVTLDSNLKSADFEKILKGVRLEDGIEKADALSYIDGDQKQLGIEIHSGKNRVIRRIFESLGYKVKKLDRVYFAGLTKKTLRRGQWRFLTEKEINMLKIGAYE